MISLTPASASVIMAIIAPSISAAANPWPASKLEARAFDSAATCQSQYSWLDNSKGQSPCQMASFVYGACAGASWNNKPLTQGNHYDQPTAKNKTVNACSCSWAAYNLIEACTLCQGLESSILSWDFWKLDCGDQVSSTYFPSSLRLSEDTRIPAYATRDPSLWKDGRFNLAEARAAHDTGDPDQFPSSSSPTNKSSSPVGAIAGGVIGGLAVILLGGLAAYFMHRRKRRQSKGASAYMISAQGGGVMGHSRNTSGMSSKSNGSGIVGLGYQRMDNGHGIPGSGGSYGITTPSSPPPMSPGATTMHTHTSSVNSLSYFGSVNQNHPASVYSPPSPPVGVRTLSPPPPSHPPPQNHHHQHNNATNNNTLQQPPPFSGGREGQITPFMLTPSPEAITREASHTNLADRKRSDGAMTPPQHQQVQQIQHHRADSGGSDVSETAVSPRRYNPPPYSTVENPTIPLPAATGTTRPPHSKKGSSEASHHHHAHSNSSVDVASAVPHHHTVTAAPSGIITAIDDVMMQMRREGLPTNNQQEHHHYQPSSRHAS